MNGAVYPTYSVVLKSNSLIFETPQDMTALSFGSYYLGINSLVAHQCPPCDVSFVITSSLVEKLQMANNDFNNMEPLALAGVKNFTNAVKETEISFDQKKLFKINNVRASTKFYLHSIVPGVQFPPEVQKTLHFSIYKLR